MSKFLAPIHFWLYKKIQTQDEMTDAILKLNEKNNYIQGLREQAGETCGSLELKPLDEIIDQSNIHGWLQNCVNIAEKRFAFVVTQLVNNNVSIEEMSDSIYEYGKSLSQSDIKTADDMFEFIDSFILDGMPCDRINTLVSNTSNELIWERTRCIHKQHWDEFDGDIQNYYTLRGAFINGLCANSGYSFEMKADGINVLKGRE